MSVASDPALLTLHGVRILGGPSATAVAERFGLPRVSVREHLLDAQANGWVKRHDFGGETWSLTEAGKAENERQLAGELHRWALRDLVAEAHRRFLPWNRLHGQACTDWQLRPIPGGRHLANDHSDPAWDWAVLGELEAADRGLADVLEPLSAALSRFAGHAERHRRALTKVTAGQWSWLDAPDRASCQLVWIQIHEDFLASLGIRRGTDG